MPLGTGVGDRNGRGASPPLHLDTRIAGDVLVAREQKQPVLGGLRHEDPVDRVAVDLGQLGRAAQTSAVRGGVEAEALSFYIVLWSPTCREIVSCDAASRSRGVGTQGKERR